MEEVSCSPFLFAAIIWSLGVLSARTLTGQDPFQTPTRRIALTLVMATRIDIEVTSDRGDGTYTWRAAGAKQPKGVFDASLLPAGATVGDVLRAEVEFTVDGPELTALTSPKAPKQDQIERIEVLGTQRPTETVTTQLAAKSRRGGGRDKRGDRDGGRRDDRGENRRPRDGGRGPNRKNALRPKRAHRTAWVATLPDTHQPVAEQLVHEGRDGVSEALARQNKAAAAEGRPVIDVGPIMKIADSLMSDLALAEWRDLAEAAMRDIDTADLRELRKVVVAGEAFSGDAEAADTQSQLRSRLMARVDRDQATWSRELREALTEGRVVRALRQSGRPAKAGVPLPPDVVEQLREAAGAALSPDEEPHRWTMVIEALAGSPVRRLVVPESKPEGADADDELLDTVERLAHLVPGVAGLFDVDVKPRKRRRRQRS